MVLPLWDHSPFKWPTPPYVMWSIVIINFLIFFVQAAGGSDQMDQVDHIAGLIPAAFTGAKISGTLPAPVALITSMFLHANFMHVFGNMIFLFVFGDDIEEVLGHWRFLLLYLACGIGAGLTFVLSDLTSTTELIGASGAVAGVISAYFLFRPVRQDLCVYSASFRFTFEPTGSLAAGRFSKSSKFQAASRTTSPIGPMWAD